MAAQYERDTEDLLADADGYVDGPTGLVRPGDPDWVEPAEGCTPVEED